jgi:hypothetical protein
MALPQRIKLELHAIWIRVLRAVKVGVVFPRAVATAARRAAPASVWHRVSQLGEISERVFFDFFLHRGLLSLPRCLPVCGVAVLRAWWVAG